MKSRGIKWFATVTTVSEAIAAESAGADVIVAQGMEAGGHRGAFDATTAEAKMVGLFSLLPAVVDVVKVPVVATGGIATGVGLRRSMVTRAFSVRAGASGEGDDHGSDLGGSSGSAERTLETSVLRRHRSCPWAFICQSSISESGLAQRRNSSRSEMMISLPLPVTP